MQIFQNPLLIHVGEMLSNCKTSTWFLGIHAHHGCGAYIEVKSKNCKFCSNGSNTSLICITLILVVLDYRLL